MDNINLKKEAKKEIQEKLILAKKIRELEKQKNTSKKSEVKAKENETLIKKLEKNIDKTISLNFKKIEEGEFKEFEIDYIKNRLEDFKDIQEDLVNKFAINIIIREEINIIKLYRKLALCKRQSLIAEIKSQLDSALRRWSLLCDNLKILPKQKAEKNIEKEAETLDKILENYVKYKEGIKENKEKKELELEELKKLEEVKKEKINDLVGDIKDG